MPAEPRTERDRGAAADRARFGGPRASSARGARLLARDDRAEREGGRGLVAERGSHVLRVFAAAEAPRGFDDFYRKAPENLHHQHDDADGPLVVGRLDRAEHLLRVLGMRQTHEEDERDRGRPGAVLFDGKGERRRPQRRRERVDGLPKVKGRKLVRVGRSRVEACRTCQARRGLR